MIHELSLSSLNLTVKLRKKEELTPDSQLRTDQPTHSV